MRWPLSYSVILFPRFLHVTRQITVDFWLSADRVRTNVCKHEHAPCFHKTDYVKTVKEQKIGAANRDLLMFHLVWFRSGVMSLMLWKLLKALSVSF